MSNNPVVLTNGAWHGSWCWNRVTTALAERSVASVAVELEGFGGLRGASASSRWARPFDPAVFATQPSPSAAVTLESATKSLIEDIRRIGQGGRCVLVAHSLGGVIATAVAEQAPELLEAVVYVAAIAPVSGMTAVEYNMLPEMQDTLLLDNIVADPAIVGALRCDFDDPQRRAHARRTFYNDLDDSLASQATALLCSDAPAQVGVEKVLVTRERYGSVRYTYVLCHRDNAIRPALQRRFIREIDAVSTVPTSVAELDSSHSPFLSQPEALADIIAAA